MKTYNTEFDEIIITFMDQNGRLLEIENKVNLLFNKKKCEDIKIWIFIICEKILKTLLDTGPDAVLL